MYIQDSYGCEDVKPRGFVSLMDLYENNYLRLKKLVPDLHNLDDLVASQVNGYPNLHIVIAERSKYTTTLFMTYRFKEKNKLTSIPNVKIRIYHDAKLVEILDDSLKHGKKLMTNLPFKKFSQKWKLNRFLYKWLGYCLYLGHQFEANKQTKFADIVLR